MKQSDIVVYELDRPTFDQTVAGAFNLTGEPVRETGLHQTTRIGIYSPYAGFRFPVFLTIQLEPDAFDSMDQWSGEPGRQAVCPARSHARSLHVADRASVGKSEVSICSDGGRLALTVRRKVCLSRPVDDILASFRTVHLPAPEDDGSMIFFPTPPDATWSDVSIRFIDGHTVSVRAMSVRKVCNYTQMGMVNRKSGDRTQQWKLLEGFANSHGQIALAGEVRGAQCEEAETGAVQAAARILPDR